jgi:hypothetical protein
MELDYGQYRWVLETLATAKDPLAYFVQTQSGDRKADVGITCEGVDEARSEWRRFVAAVNKHCRFKK